METTIMHISKTHTHSLDLV